MIRKYDNQYDEENDRIILKREYIRKKEGTDKLVHMPYTVCIVDASDYFSQEFLHSEQLQKVDFEQEYGVVTHLDIQHEEPCDNVQHSYDLFIHKYLDDEGYYLDKVLECMYNYQGDTCNTDVDVQMYTMFMYIDIPKELRHTFKEEFIDYKENGMLEKWYWEIVQQKQMGG